LFFFRGVYVVVYDMV